MIAPETFFNILNDQGIDFYTGVPDSLLKDFCAFITDHIPSEKHVIASNEGNAVALAIGWYLGTGRIPLVYMQNSGIGNAINPIASLADNEVYGFPMLLLIGWRGEPGKKDEPQHIKQGRIMIALLDSLELPWFLLTSENKDADSLVKNACTIAKKRNTPVVLLVQSGCFEHYKLKGELITNYEMNREQAIQRIISQLCTDDLVVSTTGKTSRELFEFRVSHNQGHDQDFLTVGGMGHTSSISMGLARAQINRKIICLDGDGSVLMHMGSLAIIGQSGVKNILHIVINNGAHDSVGGQPTVGFGIDLAGIAHSCGYKFVRSVKDADALDKAMSELLCCEGPSLLEVKANKGARIELGRPTSTPKENKEALMHYIGIIEQEQ